MLGQGESVVVVDSSFQYVNCVRAMGTACSDGRAVTELNQSRPWPSVVAPGNGEIAVARGTVWPQGQSGPGCYWPTDSWSGLVPAASESLRVCCQLVLLSVDSTVVSSVCVCVPRVGE